MTVTRPNNSQPPFPMGGVMLIKSDIMKNNLLMLAIEMALEHPVSNLNKTLLIGKMTYIIHQLIY